MHKMLSISLKALISLNRKIITYSIMINIISISILLYCFKLFKKFKKINNNDLPYLLFFISQFFTLNINQIKLYTIYQLLSIIILKNSLKSYTIKRLLLIKIKTII